MKVCIKCGTVLDEDAKFCGDCGAVQEEDAPAAVAAVSIPGPGVTPAKPRKSKKWVAIVCAAVALLAVAGILIGLFVSTYSPRSVAVYIKDGELYGLDLSSLESQRITKKLLDDATTDMGDLIDQSYILSMFVQITQDGKRVFYPDRMSSEDAGATIYYRSLTDPDAAPEKLDSDIQLYSIDPKGTSVIYLKADGTLYRHDLKKREKIDSDVEEYIASEDCKTVGYMTSDGDLYVQSAGEEEEKIASEIDYVVQVNDTVDTIYYMKDDTLYRQETDEDRVKIAAEVDDVYNVYASGELYYSKETTQKYKLSDYITDDKQAQDAAMVEPVAPTSPNYDDFDSFDAYMEAYDLYVDAVDAYEAQRVQYEEKLWRDTLRASLTTATVEYESNALYYFDGNEEKLLNENMLWPETWGTNETCAIVYTAVDSTVSDKVNLSELYSLDDAEDYVYSCLQDNSQGYISVGDTVTLLGESAMLYAIASDGTALYALEETEDGGECGDLYKYALTDEKPQNKELFDTEVSGSTWDTLQGDKLMYFKNMDGAVGDLYVNKEELGKEVCYTGLCYDAQSEKIAFMSDWSEQYQSGTLNLWDGSETETVSEDVHEMQLGPDGSLLYLYDYSLTQQQGELRAYQDGESQRVERDVATILPTMTFHF